MYKLKGINTFLILSLAYWLMLVILALKRLKKEVYYEFKASLMSST